MTVGSSYRTLREVVADAIRQMIVDGELAPGERLRWSPAPSPAELDQSAPQLCKSAARLYESPARGEGRKHSVGGEINLLVSGIDVLNLFGMRA